MALTQSWWLATMPLGCWVVSIAVPTSAETFIRESDFSIQQQDV